MRSAADYPYFADPPLALAHRGGAGYPPNVGIENTLAAFGAAVALGYRHLETDVHATADGELVAFHDPRLDRVTDATGAVAQLPWAQVRRARVGGREPVPLLAEVLDAFPRARVNVDIKAAGAVAPLWELIERLRAHDRVCVGSFSTRRLAAFRRLAGDRVATSAGPLGTAGVRLAPSLARHLGSPAQALQVPVEVVVAGRRLPVVTPRLLAHAHRAGKQVHVWTVDDPHLMHRLLDLGVDGLVTDRIEVLREVLLARGCWPSAQ